MSRQAIAVVAQKILKVTLVSPTALFYVTIVANIRSKAHPLMSDICIKCY